MRNLVLFLLAAAVAPSLKAGSIDSMLDAVGDWLLFSSSDHNIRLQISGSIELDAYSFDLPAPALIRSDDDFLINPRAILFLDLEAGESTYGFAQVRIDRGYDPADEPAELRLDEFAIRFTPWHDGRLNLQAGQFATVVGQWVHRHSAWQNAFISAPLIYENPTRLTDLFSRSNPLFLTRSFSREGYYYNPVIWGASYTSGFAASGSWRQFQWAAELKNAALMSRPELWSLWDKNFEKPTVSGRIEWHPDLRWKFGVSASHGNWAGTGTSFEPVNDYQQRLVMFDVSYEYRFLQIWAEYAISTFSYPGLDSDLDTHVWFIEARYKLTPRLFLAVRWNEQRYADFYYQDDNQGEWGADLERADLALTWRFNAHSQIQLEVDRYWGSEERTDGFVVSGRFTLRF